MAHSEKWAKRLLGRLPAARFGRRRSASPAIRPAELLENPSFWDPTFLRLYLDRLDGWIFDDPQKALKWAEVAPRLALKVPEESGPAGRRAHREALAKAHAILGGAYRAVSRPNDAEEPYRLALRIAESEALGPSVRVFLNQRLSYLRVCQGRPKESLRLLDETLELQGPKPCLDRSDTLVRRGDTLARLGRFAEALKNLDEALRGINPKESATAERTYHAAIHNLGDTIAKANLAGTSLNHGDAWTALEYIRKAREPLKGKRLSVAFHKLNWTEGLCWRALGMDARAEQALKVARRGFIRLRLPWEIALVSLDLCALHRECSEWPELESLAADTYQRFRALSSGDTQALAALSLCADAARARTALSATAGRELLEQAQRNAAAAISGAREVIIARMARP